MEISQVGANSYTPVAQGEVAAAPRSQSAAATVSRLAASDLAKASVVTDEVPSKAVEAVKETVNPASLKQATEKLNQAIKMMASNLQFVVDEDTGIDVVKVVDTDTKEVIRQFPSDEILAIAKAFDKLQGLLVRDKA